MGTYILETSSGSTYVVELTSPMCYFSGNGWGPFSAETASAPVLGKRYNFAGLITTSVVVKMTARMGTAY